MTKLREQVEREIEMMQEEVLVGEEVISEKPYEKDKSHGDRRKAGFKAKSKKMEIGQRNKETRKEKDTGKCGISQSKKGTHYTHEKPDGKAGKKATNKKVRQTKDVGKGNSYKKI